MITTGNWPNALETVVKKIYDEFGDNVESDRDMIYTVRKTSKMTESYMELGGLAPMGKFNGTVNYANIDEGYKFTVTAVQYAQGIKIQRAFVDTDQQDIIQGLPKKLRTSVDNRIATDTFYPFNNAFNSSITTLDGLSLGNSAHTSKNGGSNQSNIGTTAFGPVAVEAARLRAKKFLTNVDTRFKNDLDMLIVPDDLEEAAYELISSSGKVDTANNNVNFHKGKYKLLVSSWLDDTSNWFFVNSKLMKEYMDWNNIVEPEFNQDKQFDDYAAKYSVYTHYSYVPKNWRFAFCSEVS